MNLLDKYSQQKWVVAVSGGPDSMALLSMCIQANLDIFVVHINYQKRDTADRDMEIVQKYCRRHGVRSETVFYDESKQGNFQALAREFRYKIFEEISLEKNMSGVMVAHHLDDVLETYLMQKARGSTPSYYGIKSTSYQRGLRIERPLLSLVKEDLIEYCAENDVPYAHDESNASDDYERNRIRHSQIDHMSIEQKREMKANIDEENDILIQRKRAAIHFLSVWDSSKEDLLKQDDLSYIIFLWVYKESKHRISGKFIDEIVGLLKSDSLKWEKDISESYMMSLEYGNLYLYNKDKVAYEYVISTLDEFESEYFGLLHKGSVIEGMTIGKEDMPITVRSVKHDDEIELRFGTKKLNRWFIDRKIPKVERLLWPVVVNKQGKVIFVPKIGCDVAHYSVKPNLFMVKY